MLLQPDCISCILNMSTSLIRKLPLDETQIRTLLTDIMAIPALRGEGWHVTSPEVIEAVMKKITATVGDPDPFRKEKKNLNRAILGHYAFFQDLVDRSADPLYTAVNIAISGNAIDFMVPGGTADVEKTVMRQLDIPLPQKDFDAFRDKLETADFVLYLSDNAGEIVLDKLLIETIRRQYDLKIIFVVRSVPTLNDATRNETADIGMENVVRVMENGIDGPLPGTIFRRCSAEIRDLVDRADLIIAKGGGNYDSLSEEKDDLHKITFMLLSKCFPYNRDFGVDWFQPILGGVPDPPAA